jgi:hypothetical protein
MKTHTFISSDIKIKCNKNAMKCRCNETLFYVLKEKKALNYNHSLYQNASDDWIGNDV